MELVDTELMNPSKNSRTRFQLGFVSAIVPELSLEEVLSFAAREGFSCVEAMCWPVGKAERKYAGVTHVDVSNFDATQAGRVNELCAKQGVALSALGYYPNPLDPNETAAKFCVAHLKKVIVAARLLGLGTVNTFVGRDWTKSVDENWPRFLRTWRPLIKFAEEQGVRVGIENCPMLYSQDEWPGGKNLATTPVIWRRMFHDIPSNHFGLNYDPSHFSLQQMDPASPLKEFQEKLFHIHAKDTEIDRKKLNDVGVFALPKEWHRPRIPGKGEIDWTDFMRALRRASYRGPICIEVEDESFGRTVDGRKRAVRAAGNFLRPLVG
jgi:sugar phosphate isomerase/epimerase